MIIGMEDLDIERLANAIRETFAGQPYLVKYWLEVLDTAVSRDESVRNRRLDACTGVLASDIKASDGKHRSMR